MQQQRREAESLVDIEVPRLGVVIGLGFADIGAATVPIELIDVIGAALVNINRLLVNELLRGIKIDFGEHVILVEAPEGSNSFEGFSNSVLTAGAMSCLVAM